MAPEALNKVKGQVLNKFKDLQDLVKAKKGGSGGGGGGGGPMAKVTGGFKKVTGKIPGLKKGSAPVTSSKTETLKNLPKKLLKGKSKNSAQKRWREPSFGVADYDHSHSHDDSVYE